MGLRDMLKKKDRLSEGYSADATETVGRLAAPEFTFIRSDTHTEERIFPPAPEDEYQTAKDSSLAAAPAAKPRRSLDVFKSRSRGNSAASPNSNKADPFADASASPSPPLPSPQLPQQRQQQQQQQQQQNNSLRPKDTVGRRLSQRLHIGSSSSRRTSTSEFVPENLPTINLPPDAAEPEWEARATILAQQAEQARSRSGSVTPSPLAEKQNPYELPPLNIGAEYNGDRGSPPSRRRRRATSRGPPTSGRCRPSRSTPTFRRRYGYTRKGSWSSLRSSLAFWRIPMGLTTP
ncbi:hypothetical protein PG997_002924 [Apiospora hydei]|uniref:Uncharacterized protein n=1 Tax=Apiospora hydei TaxID=1337664 RepID=A0ABR1WXW2_9PEZI